MSDISSFYFRSEIKTRNVEHNLATGFDLILLFPQEYLAEKHLLYYEEKYGLENMLESKFVNLALRINPIY